MYLEFSSRPVFSAKLYLCDNVRKKSAGNTLKVHGKFFLLFFFLHDKNFMNSSSFLQTFHNFRCTNMSSLDLQQVKCFTNCKEALTQLRKEFESTCNFNSFMNENTELTQRWISVKEHFNIRACCTMHKGIAVACSANVPWSSNKGVTFSHHTQKIEFHCQKNENRIHFN